MVFQTENYENDEASHIIEMESVLEVENDANGVRGSNMITELEVEMRDDYMFYPQVPDTIKPGINKKFASLDDAWEFYNTYAKESGFSIRKWTERKKGDEITRKAFVCFKQGKGYVVEDVESTRRKGSIRDGCKAKLTVAKTLDGTFAVKVFLEGHSHKLTSPDKIQFLRSHRSVSSAQRSLNEQMDMVNVPTHQQYDLLVAQAGGFENVGCTQKDLENHRRDMRMKMKGHDGEMLLEYLELEQEKNPSFTFKIEADDEQRITHCFWADATSRRDYASYGDVIIFDTTYNTNRYGMIFAPLMGVNNHGQTIILACAFLSDETIESFVWLFKQFMEAMPGDAPKMIITDQDPAMTNAISQSLPNTYHRYCIWHILNKFSEKLDTVKYKTYYDQFSTCIWGSKTTGEFDCVWKKLVEVSGQNENRWLQSMFEIWEKWVPIFVSHVFSAGMSSSQRAESGHSFFKRYVKKDNSLVDFMVKFSRGLQKQRHTTLLADHKDVVEKPKVTMIHNVLLQMVDVYTREIFFKFQEELLQSFNYKFQLVEESGARLVYSTKRKGVETDQGRKIVYDKELEFISCSCNKFESVGIPCRHILGYLHKFHDFDLLPEEYILKRWTKSAKSGTIIDNGGMEVVNDRSYFLERSRLIQCCLGVVDKALRSAEAKKVLMDALGSAEDKINLFVGKGGEKTNQTVDCGTHVDMPEKMSCDDQPTYREPNQVRTKGCGKRLKGGKEISVTKSKQASDLGKKCHGCGLYGQRHNIRSCPKAIAERSTGTTHNDDDVATDVPLSPL